MTEQTENAQHKTNGDERDGNVSVEVVIVEQ